MKRLLVLASAVGALLALSAPPAVAAAPYPPWVLVIRDCLSNGKLDGTYRPADLATALHRLRGDGDEYSDCANAIRLALDGGSGKRDRPPADGIVTGSGAVASSPDDVAKLQSIVAAADAGQGAPRASSTDSLLGDFDHPSAPPYRFDPDVLAAVFGAWLVPFTGAIALRHRRRALPARPRA